MTDAAAEGPARFVHTKVYVSEPTAAGMTGWLPELAFAPFHCGSVPLAVQPWLLAEDQVSVVELPTVMELAAKESVGVGGTNAGIALAAKLACTNPKPEAVLYPAVPPIGRVLLRSVE